MVHMCKMILSPGVLFILFFFSKFGFTTFKDEQPLQGMDLQEKETQKDKGIQEIWLERTYS